VTDLIKERGWCALKVQRRENRLLYKILNNDRILDKDQYCKPATYMGRQDHTRKIYREASTKKYISDSFKYRTVVDWNKLKENVASAENVKTFKKLLKQNRETQTCSHTKT